MSTKTELRRGYTQPAARSGINTRFVVGGILVAVIVAYLGFWAVTANSAYYMSVPEVMAQREAIANGSKNVRVDGWIKAGSIKWEPQQTLLNFTITDEAGKASFPVTYKGVKPDNMEDPELQVIVEGRFDKDNIFHAHVLLTRCPSKYEDKPQTSQTGQ